jgi:hypothetical protein
MLRSLLQRRLPTVLTLRETGWIEALDLWLAPGKLMRLALSEAYYSALPHDALT